MRLRVALAMLAVLLPSLTGLTWLRLSERTQLLHSGAALPPAANPRVAQLRAAWAAGASPRAVAGISSVLLTTTLLALGAVLLATGPVVRRIRRLTREVERASQDGYRSEITVSGTDEIGELARAFTRAQTQIRVQLAQQAQREQALRTFLEDTTHDVMTPLTVLQGHLASFEQHVARGAPLSQERVGKAINEAVYMAALIRNLATAATLDAMEAQLSCEPVDLGELVERVVQRHAASARQRQVQIDRAVPERPLWVRGDVTLIEQAVSNVVDNAVRYNRSGGHIAILLEHEAACFLLRVIDDGPGIAEAERARLCERHVRGNAARSREPGGRGLGLDIVYRVVKAHGWQIALAASELGGLQVELNGPVDDFSAT